MLIIRNLLRKIGNKDMTSTDRSTNIENFVDITVAGAYNLVVQDLEQDSDNESVVLWKFHTASTNYQLVYETLHKVLKNDHLVFKDYPKFKKLVEAGVYLVNRTVDNPILTRYIGEYVDVPTFVSKEVSPNE